jgi:hypothetical protein
VLRTLKTEETGFGYRRNKLEENGEGNVPGT